MSSIICPVLLFVALLALTIRYEHDINCAMGWLLDCMFGCIFALVVLIMAIFIVPYQLATGELKWGFWKHH